MMTHPREYYRTDWSNQRPPNPVYYDGSRGFPADGFISNNVLGPPGANDGFVYKGGGSSSWTARRNGNYRDEDPTPANGYGTSYGWGTLIGNMTAAGDQSWVVGLMWDPQYKAAGKPTGWFWDRADAPQWAIPQTQTTAGSVTLPPGLSAVSQTATGPKVYELSVGADGDSWFVAKTPQESASHGHKNPHAGQSGLNPSDVSFLIPDLTMQPAEFLDVQDYSEQGWHGFVFLLAYQPDTHSMSPVTDEVREAMDSAVSGDEDSQRALTRVGIKPPAPEGIQGFVGTLESRLFGRKSY